MAVRNPTARPQLELIVTEHDDRNGDTFVASPDTRARDLTQFPPQARALRRAVLAAALEAGEPIDPDAISAILAAKLATGTPMYWYSEELVWDLLWFDIGSWCGHRRLEVPRGVPRALWFLLHWLFETDRIDPASDSLDELTEPLLTAGGLDLEGQPRTPAS